ATTSSAADNTNAGPNDKCVVQQTGHAPTTDEVKADYPDDYAERLADGETVKFVIKVPPNMRYKKKVQDGLRALISDACANAGYSSYQERFDGTGAGFSGARGAYCTKNFRYSCLE
ncbi:MAG: hypothetical protein AB7P23_08865, partial [Amphiplicatus sp.]